MVRKRYNMPQDDPEQIKFEIPSEKEHLFQVSDIFDAANAPGNMVLSQDVICVKLEVIGGEEEGKTMLHRLNLDSNSRGFFAVRLFLKAIGLPHKGEVEIDTDDFQGRQFYAEVAHNRYQDKTYANIKSYNFDKMVEQEDTKIDRVKPVDAEIAWDE